MSDENVPTTSRAQCVDCGSLAPERASDFTLISRRHGWRLSIRAEPDGTRTPEWRCAPCHTKYRDSRRLLPQRPLEGKSKTDSD